MVNTQASVPVHQLIRKCRSTCRVQSREHRQILFCYCKPAKPTEECCQGCISCPGRSSVAITSPHIFGFMGTEHFSFYNQTQDLDNKSKMKGKKKKNSNSSSDRLRFNINGPFWYTINIRTCLLFFIKSIYIQYIHIHIQIFYSYTYMHMHITQSCMFIYVDYVYVGGVYKPERLIKSKDIYLYVYECVHTESVQKQSSQSV